MTEKRPPTIAAARSAPERSAVVIDLAARRPRRAPAAQPSSGWYHEAALREGDGAPRRCV